MKFSVGENELYSFIAILPCGCVYASAHDGEEKYDDGVGQEILTWLRYGATVKRVRQNSREDIFPRWCHDHIKRDLKTPIREEA